MADNKTYSIDPGEVTRSGSGSVHAVSMFSSFNELIDSNIPKYSEITAAIVNVSAKETTKKVGNADLYFYFAASDGSYKIELYYGNGVIPKGSFFTTPDISIKDYLSSKSSTSGHVSYSGADRFCIRCQSSLLSRDYTLRQVIKITYNEPRAKVTVSGGSGAGTYHWGNNIALTPNSKAGHTFKHWSCSNGKTYTSNTIKVDSNIITVYETSLTFTAVYTANTYTVTFKNYDGTVLKTQSVEYGKSATAPSNPTRAYDASYHYSFKGWDKSYSSITGNTTVTATYTATAHSYTTETSRTPSTCYTKGSVTKKCSCGRTQTTELALDSSNHAGGTEVKNAKAATCTATGYSGDTYCKGCGAKIKSGSTIAALGHSYKSVVTPPTETSQGYTTHTCSRCGDSYVDSYVAPLKINKIYVGTSQPKEIYVGTTKVKAVYIGTTKIYG